MMLFLLCCACFPEQLSTVCLAWDRRAHRAKTSLGYYRPLSARTRSLPAPPLPPRHRTIKVQSFLHLFRPYAYDLPARPTPASPCRLLWLMCEERYRRRDC
uniref:Putative secreted protein n=1 Tax=Anopheles darlingi TaxID=43151 RepID=A0A2M4D1V8_ANODA